MMKETLLWLMILVSSGAVVARAGTSDSTVIEQESSSFPKFDVHIGMGTVSGGRLGIRARINQLFSFEVTYGNDFRNFLGLSDIEKRYTVGVNFHLARSSNQTMSIIFMTRVRPYQPPLNAFLKDNYMSVNFGWVPFVRSGLHPFFRGGLIFRISKDPPGSSDDLINLDLGLSYVFP